MNVECGTSKDNGMYAKTNIHANGKTGTCEECIGRLKPLYRECSKCGVTRPQGSTNE